MATKNLRNILAQIWTIIFEVFTVYLGYMTLPFPHIILVHFYILPIFRQKRCASCRNRYRNRNVRNRRRLNNARDENRYRNRGSNNNNRNRDQPSRQGFGFENNFWTDGDANDFFRFVYFLLLCTYFKNKTLFVLIFFHKKPCKYF